MCCEKHKNCGLIDLNFCAISSFKKIKKNQTDSRNGERINNGFFWATSMLQLLTTIHTNS